MNRKYINKTCPYCKTPLVEGDTIVVCSVCDMPHHLSCWQDNQGCTTFGCTGYIKEIIGDDAGIATAPAAPQPTPAPVIPPMPVQTAPANPIPAPVQVEQAEKPIEILHETKEMVFMSDVPIVLENTAIIIDRTNPTGVCSNCGAPLGDGQAFCHRCGTPKAAAPKKNVCGNCGNELLDGQEFCPRCGSKAGVAVDNHVNAAINQFNAGVEKQKQKSKKLPIVLAVVLVAAIAIGAFVSNTISAKKAEEARDEYIENVEEFLSLSLTAGSNLEDIADTIQEYWYDNIWNDMWGDDIDDAILYAMIAKSDEIDQAETYDAQMRDLYSKIKKVPADVAEEDADDLEELCEAVKDLYDVYTEFYILATDPSGSYNTYSESNAETTDEFLSCYRALENLLD